MFKFFYFFHAKNNLFEQFGLKNINYLFQMKLDVKPNSNMLNSVVVLTFLVLGHNYSFRAVFIQKIKIVCLTQSNSNMLNYMEMYICPILPFLKMVVPKNQNSLFKMKVGIQANSNMLNSMVKFTFPDLDRKISFWSKCGRKNKNCLIQMKLGDVNLNCFLPEIPFLDKFGPKN